ncbi:MAG: glycosyltransferase [Planctomycetota bacterium]
MSRTISRAQWKMGCPADSCVITRRSGRGDADIFLNLQNQLDILRFLPRLISIPFKYNVFQFYFDLSLIPGSFDLPFLKMLGKKVFFWFCGCDVRNPQMVLKKYRYNGCRECSSRRCSPFRSSVIRMARWYADKIFYTTPDLAEFLPPEAIWLPVPVDLLQWSYQKTLLTGKNKIKIAHAPTDRLIKGTGYLLQAIDLLKKKGYDVEPVLIENMPYEEVRKAAGSADLAVDQLLIGSYGLFSAEMMALGKPVICYIRDDLKEKYPPGLPIISANRTNIFSVLKNLVDEREKWNKLGEQGRAYVENVHDVNKICRQLLKYYTEDV